MMVTKKFSKAIRGLQTGQTDRALDYLYNTRNCANGNSRMHIRRLNADGTEDAIAMPCRSWSCPSCSRQMRDTLMAGLVQNIEGGIFTTFVTLTLPLTYATSPKSACLKSANAFHKLCRNFSRASGKPLQYAWFREIKDRMVHLHLLTGDIDNRVFNIKREWHRLTGAQQVKILPIDRTPEYLARYVIKSIAKQSRQYGKTLGRWWGSSNGLGIRCRPQRGNSDGWKPYQGNLDLEHIRRRGAVNVRTNMEGNVTRATLLPDIKHNHQVLKKPDPAAY